MFKKRDAQGLSINVIIIACIAIIVLIVLITIFSKESSNTVEVLGSCAGRGGVCVKDKPECDGMNGKIIYKYDCEPPTENCCYSLD